MQPQDLLALCKPLQSLIRKAGDEVLQHYQQNTPVLNKADQSPLTQADLGSHRVLAAGLPAMAADCPVVSEEDEASEFIRRTAPRFWLIDPLDGTKEFLAGNGEFTVNIALVEKGRAVLGVVLAPALGELFWGGPGLGAFKAHHGVVSSFGNASGSPSGSPSHNTVPASPLGSLRVVASKSHLNADTERFIAALRALGKPELVQAGSSLKFCRLAEGLADLYPRLSPTCEWDTAAAQAVLEGAGGAVQDLQGQPLRYGKPSNLNPSFVAARSPSLLKAALAVQGQRTKQ